MVLVPSPSSWPRGQAVEGGEGGKAGRRGADLQQDSYNSLERLWIGPVQYRL